MSENVNNKKTSVLKKICLTVIGFSIMTIVLVSCLAGGEKETPTTSSSTTQEQSKVDSGSNSGITEEQKNAILAFEKEIYTTEKVATQALEEYAKKAADMGTGKATIYDVYSAASTAKDKCKEVQFTMNKIKTPEVSKEINTLLRDVKVELSTAYMVKAEALDSAMKFLDNQKPSDLQKFKDDIKNADNFIMGAVLKLTQAKEKAGIDIAKQ